MASFRAESNGERLAEVYDDWYSQYDETCVTTLRELAQGERALELGIGTGRVALPLHRAGVKVDGIDISEAMLARLHAKPGAEGLSVTHGNFADVPVEGHYALIYVVFNTFLDLATQDEQIRCFENAAKHLRPTGVFLIEAVVPDLTLYDGRQAVRAVGVGASEVLLDVSRLDPVSQRITRQYLVMTEQGVRMYPTTIRYVWPAELDLMARIAGLRLKHRWGSWDKAAFSAASRRHISVYQHAA